MLGGHEARCAKGSATIVYSVILYVYMSMCEVARRHCAKVVFFAYTFRIGLPRLAVICGAKNS